jgi:serine/threonine protein kinase/tetratricopeptide (TPR) repeat protein
MPSEKTESRGAGACDSGLQSAIRALLSPAGAASSATRPQPADKSVCLDRAHDEYCRLRAAGEAPELDRSCARYPAFKTSLRRLLEAHQFLEEAPELLAQYGTVEWPEAGGQFLGFNLLAELGRGGLARVFLASQPELGGRPVAVKVSLRGAAEAETLGRLVHPNIVAVHSVEEDPFTGLTAVCMPFLGRATLCDVLDHAFRPLPIPASAPAGGSQAQSPPLAPSPPRYARAILDALEVVRQKDDPAVHLQPPDPPLREGTYIDGVLHLAAQLADALAFTHAQGVCHRDLKPSNVLLTPDGRPMLLDFNLASDERGEGVPLGGTLPYMAPEHLRATDPDGDGDPSLIGPASDLFALGVILYELLTGQHPFGPLPSRPVSASASQSLRADLLERQQRGPALLRRANPHVDRSLARLVERCLAFDPAARPPSAAELAAALRKGRGRLARSRRWLRRHPRVVAVLAVLILAVGVGGAYGLSLHESPAPSSFESETKLTPRELFLLGLHEQRQGNLIAAEELYEKADPELEDMEVQIHLAWCRTLLRKHRDAIGNYAAAEDKGANSAAFFNNYGWICCSVKEGRYRANAEKYFTQAIDRDRHFQAAYHNRAVLIHLERALAAEAAKREDAFILEALKPAIADIETAIRLGPATTELYRDAAGICAFAAEKDRNAEGRKQKRERALELVQRARELGQDPEELRKDRLFRLIEEELRGLGPLPGAPKPTRAILFVDPVPHIP